MCNYSNIDQIIFSSGFYCVLKAHRRFDKEPDFQPCKCVFRRAALGQISNWMRHHLSAKLYLRSICHFRKGQVHFGKWHTRRRLAVVWFDWNKVLGGPVFEALPESNLNAFSSHRVLWCFHWCTTGSPSHYFIMIHLLNQARKLKYYKLPDQSTSLSGCVQFFFVPSRTKEDIRCLMNKTSRIDSKCERTPVSSSYVL